MMDKYRVHELAKDWNMNSKDVLALLENHFPDDQRKHMTALTDEQLNVALDSLTKSNQVENITEYFENSKKKAGEAVNKENPITPAVAAETKAPTNVVADAKTPVATPVSKTPVATPVAAPVATPVVSTPAVAPIAKPTATYDPTKRSSQNTNPINNQNRKPSFNNNNNNSNTRRPPMQNNSSRPPVQNSAPRPPMQNNAPKPPVQNATSSATAQTPISNKVVRPATTHVDMRPANVNLDKYNERYEQIAPTNIPAKNQGPSKQKFGNRYNRGKPFRSRKEQEAEKIRRIELERQRRQKLEVTLPEEMTVGELALKLKVQAAEVIKRLMSIGIMASVSEVIDYDTATLVAMEIGAKVEREVVVTIEERLFEELEEKDESRTPRCPVVVVMGHVDHGKTSLLDAIRKTNVTAGEAGGITQHIGAYQVVTNGSPITFLDTPGHAAFTSMRARGAQVTDIAILVVAADDGVMPQTIEAINHAKAAGVAIIVAINKMDKPGANPERVKQELTEHGIVCEEWGGDAICVPVSAKKGEGVDELLEMVSLVAETLELTANPDRLAKGTVIEAKLDKGRGPLATVLIQSGTIRTGDIVIAGTSIGRVRVMLDDNGNKIEVAGPSTPVEIAGLSEVPTAGDTLNVVEDERLARELVSQRRHEAKEEVFSTYQKVTLDNLFTQISEGDMQELPLIIKADVDGSVEAVRQSLEKLSTDEIRVKVIHGAVGAVSESDVMLANASNAIIIGFNVRPDNTAREIAERDQVDMRLYRVIYDAINEIADAMKGMLAPKIREKELGRAEIRQVLKISSVGTVAGCYVLNGKITRNALIRIVRDGIIVADDKLDSLKRFKDDVKEVATGYECGMSLVKFADIREGDIFEAYEMEEYRD